MNGTRSCPAGTFNTVDDVTGDMVCADCEAGTFRSGAGTERCVSCGNISTVCPGRDGCYPDALQMIYKSSFSFSSFDSGRDNAELLQVTSAWQAATEDAIQWLQIDSGRVSTVAGVATQGGGYSDCCVLSYSVSLSNDSTTWTAVDDGAIFVGNTDMSSVVRTRFRGAILARYVRIKPVSWYNSIAMRAALLGGHTADDCGEEMISCPAGKISSVDDMSGDMVCTDCEAGTFKRGAGIRRCISCEADTTVCPGRDGCYPDV